jgi:hypothetical protein
VAIVNFKFQEPKSKSQVPRAKIQVPSSKNQNPNSKFQVMSKLKIKIPIILFVLVVVITCTKSDYNPNLVEYIKDEKELRSRITEEQGLSDSIKILQQKHNIDLEEELSKLSDNPEDWIKLLKDLKIAK